MAGEEVPSASTPSRARHGRVRRGQGGGVIERFPCRASWSGIGKGEPWTGGAGQRQECDSKCQRFPFQLFYLERGFPGGPATAGAAAQPAAPPATTVNASRAAARVAWIASASCADDMNP